MNVDFPGGGRCSLIMSAVMKPELYFQPEIKQKKSPAGCHIKSLTPGLLPFLPEAREREARLLSKAQKSALLFSAEKLGVEAMGAQAALFSIYPRSHSPCWGSEAPCWCSPAVSPSKDGEHDSEVGCPKV